MSEAFAFGPFRLLVARRELLAHGVPITLGQRAFEILLLLVSRHGQLVTKDELMAETRLSLRGPDHTRERWGRQSSGSG